MARRKPPRVSVAPVTGGYYEPPPSPQRDMRTVRIEDPEGKLVHAVDQNGRPYLAKEKLTVGARANTSRDIILQWRDKRHICEAEFQIGRLIQEVVGWGGPSGGGQWQDGDRVDAASAHEWAIAANVDRGREAVAMTRRIDALVGADDRHVLIQVLCGGLRFKDIAAHYQHEDQDWLSKSDGEEIGSYAFKHESHYAFLFARVLRTITKAWVTARGSLKPNLHLDDKPEPTISALIDEIEDTLVEGGGE